MARAQIQQFIRALLEEEVTELLGRTKSARREAVDAAPGYLNGYGKPRRLNEWDHHRVPAPLRDLNERFVSRVLPLFKRQTKEPVGSLLRRAAPYTVPWTPSAFRGAAARNPL